MREIQGIKESDMIKSAVQGVLLAGLLGAASAQAATFDLTTGSNTNLGDSFNMTEDGITLTISESYGTRRLVQNVNGIGVGPRGFILDSGAIDGLGLNEFVSLSFSESVLLESITFGGWDGNDDVTFTGLSIAGFGGDGGTATINEIVSAFTLGAVGLNDNFRISSITVSAVPVPAAAWLFGSALLGMIGLRRNRV
jgi:hypothetical protein